MTSVEYLGSYRLTQSDDYFKLGRDSVLLARFATLRKGWSVCDLCCSFSPSGRRSWTGWASS